MIDFKSLLHFLVATLNRHAVGQRTILALHLRTAHVHEILWRPIFHGRCLSQRRQRARSHRWKSNPKMSSCTIGRVVQVLHSSDDKGPQKLAKWMVSTYFFDFGTTALLGSTFCSSLCPLVSPQPLGFKLLFLFRDVIRCAASSVSTSCSFFCKIPFPFSFLANCVEMSTKCCQVCRFHDLRGSCIHRCVFCRSSSTQELDPCHLRPPLKESNILRFGPCTIHCLV